VKTVLLLRHGKSDWSTAVGDRERPLAKRGRKAARAIGEFLTRAGEAPDAIVASPARRAADTATLAAAAGGWQSPLRTSELLYGAEAFSLLAVARTEADDVHRLMVVGHEPALSEAVALFVGGGNFHLPTAAVAGIVLEVERWADVEPGRGELAYLVRPRMLERS
jgi:phosphohistidine phosphatase